MLILLSALHNKSYAQGPNPTPYPFPTGGAQSIGASLPNCMKDVVLPISTGVDYQASPVGVYSYGVQDKYWHLVSNDNGPDIICAKVYNTNCNQIYQGTKAISAVPNGDCINNCNVWGDIKNGHKIYRFRRYFWIDAAENYNFSCHLSLDLVQDDKLDAVKVNDNSIGFSSGINNNCKHKHWDGYITIHGGLNYIDVDILNAQIGYGNTSPMYVNILGILSYAGNPIFVKNKYFVPNNVINMGGFLSCAPPNQYLVQPIITNTCLPDGVQGSVTVSNYDANFIYTLKPGNLPIANTFTGIGGNTYTVTIKDNKDCELNKIIKLGNPKMNLSADNNCLTPNSTSTITVSVLSGEAPYEYSLNGDPYQQANTFGGLSAGIYTITVLDAQGCTSTSTIQIVNAFTASLVSDKLCVSLEEAATLTATNTSNFPPVNYTFIPGGGIFLPPNQYQVTQDGIYTVFAADSFGCTTQSTVMLYQNAIPNMTISPLNNLAPCANTALELKALPDIPGLNYTWTGSPFPPFVPNGNPTQVNNNASGTYTVTATDVNGCTKTASFTHYKDPFCCTDLHDQAAVIKISTFPQYNNGTATGIYAALGQPVGSVITTNAHFLIDGDITVDQNLIFENCPNLHFMPNAQLRLTDGKTLTIKNSILDAACDVWSGIFATNNTQTVIISDSSVLRNMVQGVRIFGLPSMNSAALLQVSNSSFQSNVMSIYIRNTPIGYTSSVIGSTFIDALPPSPQTALLGIQIDNCLSLTIGSNISTPNKFLQLKNGITILGGGISGTMNINLINNLFEDIYGGPQVNQYWNNIYQDAEGCAIYAIDALNTNINLNINNFNANDIHFKNVHKGVITSHVNTTIRNANSENVRACFMNTLTTGKRYIFTDCHIQNSWVGIGLTGNELQSYIRYNKMELPDYPVYMYGFPVPFETNGIQLDRLNNTHTGSHICADNTILMNFKRNQNAIWYYQAGPNCGALKNTIIQPPFSYQDVFFYNKPTGIFVENSNGSILQENILKLKGHLATGFKIQNSSNLRMFCNEIDACYSMTGTGNCGTADSNIGNNRMNGGNTAAAFDMYFNTLAGTNGYFGYIGSELIDMNNKFYGINPYTRVYKTSPGAACTPYTIYTASSNLTQANSTSDYPFCYYWVENPLNPAPQYWCNPPLNIPAYTPVADMNQALKVAQGAAQYPGFQEMSLSNEQEKLYAVLDRDSALRSHYAVLDSFYNSKNGTAMQALCRAKTFLSAWETDSVAMEDSLLFVSGLEICKQSFNNISTTNDWEQKQKDMYLTYLFLLEKGSDSLSSSQKEAIESLAETCPFVNGSAVYLARTLQAMYQTGIRYDDKILCDGTYKNGTSYSDDEKAYEEMMSQYEKLLSTKKHIKLYPNPASTQLTIEYMLDLDEKGIIELCDIVGKKLFGVELPVSANKVSIDVTQLPKGIYLYKYIINNKPVETGKLIKE